MNILSTIKRKLEGPKGWAYVLGIFILIAAYAIWESYK